MYLKKYIFNYNNNRCIHVMQFNLMKISENINYKDFISLHTQCVLVTAYLFCITI